VFSVYIPAAEGAGVAPSPSQEQALERGNGETVLLVDDEPMLAALGEEMLAALGYEPVGVTSSAEALRLFKEDPERFDAVLTDEVMPDLAGTALAAAIHSLRPDVPVVLMSGYSDPATTERAQRAGIRDVLRKPLQSADLARALAAALPRERAPKAAPQALASG